MQSDTTLYLTSTTTGGLSLYLSNINSIMQCLALMVSVVSLTLALLKEIKTKTKTKKLEKEKLK